MLMLVGIFEAARMIFIYGAMTTAAREASRYASAVGLSDNGVEKYNDCQEIIEAARRSAFFAPISVRAPSPERARLVRGRVWVEATHTLEA